MTKMPRKYPTAQPYSDCDNSLGWKLSLGNLNCLLMTVYTPFNRPENRTNLPPGTAHYTTFARHSFTQ